MNDASVVGIADMKILKNRGTIITYALGSCVGVCLYDSMVKVGAMVHIMLPLSMENSKDNLFKYADTGIRETVKAMERMGASKARVTAKIAGGAKMFDLPGSNGSGIGNIGMRNIVSVKAVLKQEGIKILKEDVGANYARTLSFNVETGNGVIRSFGRSEMNI